MRAVNMETGKRVAMKIMRRRHNQEEGGLSEGEYMKRVQSKHIVKVDEVFRRGDMEHIVMELAEMDLLELVNALGSIEEDVARHFFRAHSIVQGMWQQWLCFARDSEGDRAVRRATCGCLVVRSCVVCLHTGPSSLG